MNTYKPICDHVTPRLWPSLNDQVISGQFLICPIASAAAAFPHKIALVTEEKLITYQELEQLVLGYCHILRKHHLEPEARVAFLAKNTWQNILLFFALFRLRLIACPIPLRFSQLQITDALHALDPALFVDTETFPLCYSSSSQGTYISENQPATLLFSSGSTGRPKIVCHNFGNHFYNALGMKHVLNLHSADRYLLSLPIYHVGGLAAVFRVFLAGATLVLSEKPLSESLSHYHITHISLVPTQLYRLLKHEPPLYLKTLLLGGAPISSSLRAEAKMKGLRALESYGLTEMSSAAYLFGLPTPAFREITLSPEGEILVRGKCLFQGYWSKDKGLTLPLTAEGWFPTRDLGKWTPEGHLEVIGRKDNLFISGGENIYPEEIENILCTLPGITAAVVIPVSDPEFGERPIAFLAEENKQHTKESIAEALALYLPRFKHPIQIYALPPEMINNSKPNRAALKELLSDYTGDS